MDVFNLLDESFTTVKVRFFNADEEAPRASGKTYSYKVPRDWHIAVDDLLIVYAVNTLRIVKVDQIDEEPDFSGFPNLQYAVQRVDLTAHAALKEREQTFRKAIKAVERAREKESLINTLRTSAGTSDAARVLLGEALSLIGLPNVVDGSAEPPPFPSHPAAPDDTTRGARTAQQRPANEHVVNPADVPL